MPADILQVSVEESRMAAAEDPASCWRLPSLPDSNRTPEALTYIFFGGLKPGRKHSGVPVSPIPFLRNIIIPPDGVNYFTKRK
jgi:hypothetical protein